jgi:class 3 adenylate cyclase
MSQTRGLAAILAADVAGYSRLMGADEEVSAPDWIEPDPRHPDRIRSYKAIAEHDGRVLRVVHRPEGDDILIITVHFDRRARR